MNTGTAPTKEPKRFTVEEAQDKIGRRVQLREAFARIPAGTSGRVIQADEIHPDFFDLLIEWEQPGRGTPAPDWFTQDEYERYLEEC